MKSSYTTPICPASGERGEAGWEYRVRPTAIGPVELSEDLKYDQNKEGIVFKPALHKPPKAAAAAAAAAEDAASSPKKQGQEESLGSTAVSKKERKEATPEEQFYIWAKDHHASLLDAMTALDGSGKGLIPKQKFFQVVEKSQPPMPIEDVAALPPTVAERVDYASVLGAWRTAGVRNENKQRAGPASTATIPRLAAQFPGSAVPFDKLPEIRSHITAASSKLGRQREADRARATQAVIERMNLSTVAPAPRRAMTDACLVYSPSRRTAAKLLHTS